MATGDFDGDGHAAAVGYQVAKADARHSVQCVVTGRNAAGAVLAAGAARAIPGASCDDSGVRGMTVAGARRKLEASSCSVGRIRHATSKTVRKGRVIRAFRAGRVVDLYVSR